MATLKRCVAPQTPLIKGASAVHRLDASAATLPVHHRNALKTKRFNLEFV